MANFRIQVFHQTKHVIQIGRSVRQWRAFCVAHFCEKAAENGVLSTAPQTREPRCFKTRFSHLRQALTVLSLRSASWFLGQKIPLTGDLVWLLDL